MNRLIILTLMSLLALSCSTGNDRSENSSKSAPIVKSSVVSDSSILIAEKIIYDVIIIPQSEDDEWENERLMGYNGSQMVNDIFDAIYNQELKVFDYFTGSPLSSGEVKKMERSEGLNRDKIGKIQFTENWYFNRESLEIEKEIVSIVPGYESRSIDGIISYKAAFRLDYPGVGPGI